MRRGEPAVQACCVPVGFNNSDTAQAWPDRVTGRPLCARGDASEGTVALFVPGLPVGGSDQGHSTDGRPLTPTEKLHRLSGISPSKPWISLRHGWCTNEEP